MAKTAYHSELVELSSKGPLKIIVASDVRKSKFPDKPNFVYLKIGDSPEERPYSFDSTACEKFFTGQKGRTIFISASGSRDTAAITYVGEPGSNMAPAQPPVAPPPPIQAPPAHQPPPAQPHAPAAPQLPPPPVGSSMSNDAALKATKRFIGQRLSLMKVCVKAVASMQSDFKALMKVDMSEEQFGLYVRTLYISGEAQGLAMRSGFADAMPSNISLDTLAPPAKPAPSATAGAPTPAAAPQSVECPKCRERVQALMQSGMCPKCDEKNDDVPF